MNFFDVLNMVGGLALFLYGMHVMGEGLSKVSGGRMEKILEKLTGSPIKGVLLGTIVTAVIQSSSATTVMVVGFVNSGIMKLSQAIGVIMGANIGTTVTSWILSLSGIESDSFFIQLLKPTSFAPVLAMIGAVLLLFAKKEKKKDIGMILIGFAVLMIGMESMSAAVEPLADVPEFTNILTMFSNPLLGILAGAILTAVIQSSSASVGILQALCKTGAVSYGTAIPIILGQNIGTCVTAMLSAIGASKNAKRTALVHLYFNIIGSLAFMVVFYAINAFVHFDFMTQAAGPAGIAVVHSAFNIVATLVLMPFSKGLEKLAYMTVRETPDEKEEPKHIQILDPRFLDTPSLAVEQCKNAADKMSELTKEALFKAMEQIEKYDKTVAEQVVMLEDQVDRYEDELGTYLVKLSSRDLSEKDSHTLSEILHCIGDFERISDHAVNIVEAAGEMHDKDLSFSKKAREELQVYTKAIQDVVNTSFRVFVEENRTIARDVEPLEEVIDFLNEEVKKRHIKRLRKGKCTIEMGFILSDITTSYERISDHCSNIALAMLEIEEDLFDTHEYMLALKQSSAEEFDRAVMKIKENYVLPE
ncbi:MAG: Na/Pi cotransporter family protein [Lachnospiraceae bacterium]